MADKQFRRHSYIDIKKTMNWVYSQVDKYESEHFTVRFDVCRDRAGYDVTLTLHDITD